MRLAFGSDHAGYALRRELAEVARELGHTVSETGAEGAAPYDYPDAADSVARAIQAHEADLGVLVCGSGIGMSIRANRHRGVRAALCCSVEAAKLARQHNHANVLCLGERTGSQEEARTILAAFLDTPTDEAERHVRRVRKLDA